MVKRKPKPNVAAARSLYVIELRRDGHYHPTGIVSLTPEAADQKLKSCTGGHFQIGIYNRSRTLRPEEITHKK